MSKMKIGDTDVEFEPSAEGAEFTIGEHKVQVDSQGQLIGAQAFGNTFEKVDGGMKITRPDGSSMTMHENGEVTVANLIPKSIGIKDLSEVESCSVQATGHTRTHRITFVNGGHVEVIYGPDGKFSSLSGNNIQQSISKDNEILLSQGNKASGTVN